MKITTGIIYFICLSLFNVMAVRAEDTSDATQIKYTGNVALTSDYIFRGFTQTWGHPAVQGGADLTAGGFAAGFWGSSLSQKSFPGASMELDLYANYGANFNDDWSWRLGLYGYVYPGGNANEANPPLDSQSFNTLEANAAITWKWLSLKYSHSLSNYFGIDRELGYRDNSQGTGYLQLDATIPLDNAWSIALHAAHTNIATKLDPSLSVVSYDPSYSDFGATLKWQFAPNWSASLGLTEANNASFYKHTSSFLNPSDTRNIGGSRGFIMLQGTF